MKRDMDLIRKILFQMEEEKELTELREIYSNEEVGYHCYLMDEAGLIVGACTKDMDSSDDSPYSTPYCDPLHLTWEGHDFLDACRSDGIWKKAKETMIKLGGSASFEVVKGLLVSLMNEQVQNFIK